MLGPRLSKIWHDLWGNKTRTILIVLSIAVGLFAMGMIISSQAILSTELDRGYREIHPSTGTVRTIQTFDDGFVRSIERMNEVAVADARYLTSARVQLPSGEWTTITLFAIKDYDKQELNIVYPDVGAWPPPDRAVLIERAAMGVLEAEISDTLVMETRDGKLRELSISGTAHDLSQVPAQIDRSPYGYISMETAQWLGEPSGYNELNILAVKANTREEALATTNLVKTKAEKAGYTIALLTVAEPGQLPLNDVLQAILLLLGILGVMTLFLSGFLIVNTVSAILAQQRRQIGILKAVGATTRQVLTMYLAMVLIYGVLALIVSIPTSIIGARVLSQAMARFFNFDLNLTNVPQEAIALQIIVGLLTPIISSMIPFARGLKVTAVQAMRSDSMGQGQSRRGLIDSLLSGARLWFARHLLLRPLLLSLRNTFRSKGRLALTLLTLTLAGAIFVSVFGVRSSLDRTIVDLMAWEKFDIIITMGRAYRVSELEAEARRVPGITALEGLLFSSTRMVRSDGAETGAIYAMGLGVDAELTPSPVMTQGRWFVPGDDNAVVVTSLLLRQEPEARLGQMITLRIDGKDVPFRIVGVTMGMGASMVFLPYEYQARLTNTTGLADQIVVGCDVHDPAGTRELAATLETHLRDLGYQLQAVRTVQDELAEVDTTFAAITALLVVMAILLALVGGLGLMGTMSINVLERTREIGVLRALGAPNRGVSAVFVRESIYVGLMSWLLGSLLAVPLSHELSNAMGVALLGEALSFEFKLIGVWSWLVVVMGLSALASVLPARNASRLTVREVLAYE